MSKSRQEQLTRKLGKKLVRSVVSVLPKQSAAMDFVVYWPPDEENGSLSFLAEVDRDEANWGFRITGNDWAVGDARRNANIPRDLFADIKAFFRATWKQILERTGVKHAGYLRIHDDIASYDLRTGKLIKDDNRQDIQAASTISPFQPKRKTNRRGKPSACKWKLGWNVRQVQKEFATEKVPKPFVDSRTLVLWLRGAEIFFRDGKLGHVNLSPPYDKSIDGVWIGQHVSDVEATLGRPTRESIWALKVGKRTCRRRWTYPSKLLNVSFDLHDCVLMIQKTAADYC